jgi:hypothetical protein
VAVAPSVGRSSSEDPVAAQLADLRSGDVVRVRRVFGETVAIEASLVPQTIRLLAWDEVSALARDALSGRAASIAGQLIDALLDPDEDFAVRRRIPRVLVRASGQRVVDGLQAGLSDARFEVRFQCARALDCLLRRDPALRVDAAAIYSRLEAELSVGAVVWESHRLLDRREAVDDRDVVWFLDDLLRGRANEMLEHVFSLLALVLPREPLQVAFRALHTDDAWLRGLALEYLESVLPEHIRRQIWELVSTEGVRYSGGHADSMAELLRSSTAIAHELRKKGVGAPGPAATPPTATPPSVPR